MGRKNYGMVSSKLRNKISYFNYLLRVKTNGGLIQNKHIGVAYKSLSKAYSLTVTLLKILDKTVFHVVYLNKP